MQKWFDVFWLRSTTIQIEIFMFIKSVQDYKTFCGLVKRRPESLTKSIKILRNAIGLLWKSFLWFTKDCKRFLVKTSQKSKLLTFFFEFTGYPVQIRPPDLDGFEQILDRFGRMLDVFWTYFDVFWINIYRFGRIGQIIFQLLKRS